MKKGGKNKDFTQTKYFEVFRRTFIKKSVSEKVLFYRKKYDIPPYGYPTLEARLKFENKNNMEAKNQIVALTADMVEEHKLPDNPWLMEDMILCGKHVEAYKFGPYMPKGLCKIVDPLEKRPVLRYHHDHDNFSRCVRIEISPYAIKDDVIDFINEKNWDTIKRLNSKNVRDTYEGISGSPDTERNQEIFEMSLSSKSDLLAYLEENGIRDKLRGYFRKEDVISHLIEHFYGTKLGVENIRRIIRSERKQREG